MELISVASAVATHLPEIAVIDHSHAHAVFIELTFGLNTVFAIYEDFRGQISKKVKEFVNQVKARTLTLEPGHDAAEDKALTDQNRRDIQKILDHMKDQESLHDRKQEGVVSWVLWAAIVCAITALTILYFDHIHACGHWCALLLLPFPAYVVFSVYNFFSFKRSVLSQIKIIENYRGSFTRTLPKITSVGAAGAVAEKGEASANRLLAGILLLAVGVIIWLLLQIR